jgi:flagellar protein FliS
MMAAYKSAIQSYASVGVETGVHSASPHKLILMLFEGATLSIARALQHMREHEVAEKGVAISKAIEIIDGGLKASLDVEAGGPLAERLAALYEYMCLRLLHANMHDSEPALTEVASLLGEIKGAWEEIANDPAVLSANRTAA